MQRVIVKKRNVSTGVGVASKIKVEYRRSKGVAPSPHFGLEWQVIHSSQWCIVPLSSTWLGRSVFFH